MNLVYKTIPLFMLDDAIAVDTELFYFSVELLKNLFVKSDQALSTEKYLIKYKYSNLI